MKPADIHVLAVDDDKLVLETIVDLFRAFGFRVDSAPGGREAWTLIKKNNYNIVITDVRMPDVDGLALVKLIKGRDPLKPSVLFISGFSDLMNEEIYHNGVEGLFNKPFDASAVKNAIQTCLLPAEAKWGRPMPKDIVFHIGKKGTDFAEMERSRAAVFGRGGLFLAYNAALPNRGQTIGFKIELNLSKPIIFSGAGVVQWSQKYSKEDSPAGVGIEITHMPPDQARVYVQLFGNLPRFIPSPKLMLSTSKEP